MPDAILNPAIEFSIWVQSWAADAAGFWRAVTFIGNQDFYLFVLPALLWLIDYELSIPLAVVVAITGGINDLFKLVFHQPRPYWVSADIKGLASDPFFSLPSGHAMLGAALWGWLAMKFRQRWVKIGLIVLIILIGFSRIALGMHFYYDVVIGWLAGAGLLWMIANLDEIYYAQMTGKTTRQKTVWLLGVTILFCAVGWVLVYGLRDFVVPEVWVNNAYAANAEELINPVSFEGTLTWMGGLFGLGVGVWWLEKRGGFIAQNGEWWHFIVRMAVGVIGVAILWKGLDAVFPRNQDLISYALRYFRFSLVVFWMVGLAPWLFVRLGIAQAKQPA